MNTLKLILNKLKEGSQLRGVIGREGTRREFEEFVSELERNLRDIIVEVDLVRESGFIRRKLKELENEKEEGFDLEADTNFLVKELQKILKGDVPEYQITGLALGDLYDFTYVILEGLDEGYIEFNFFIIRDILAEAYYLYLTEVPGDSTVNF